MCRVKLLTLKMRKFPKLTPEDELFKVIALAAGVKVSKLSHPHISTRLLHPTGCDLAFCWRWAVISLETDSVESRLFIWATPGIEDMNTPTTNE